MLFLLQRMISPKIISHQTTKLHHKNRPFDVCQAQIEGWKVKLKYHEVWGLKNVFSNRGETDYFIDDVEVLDKNFANPLRNLGGGQGHVVDTVWVVVDKAEMLKHMNK